jgi:choline dehydrogenase-like flavoprotein
VAPAIKLKSSDPYDTVVIDPGLLSHPADILIMVEAIKAAKHFLTAPAWDGYIIRPNGGLENITSDEQLADYVRTTGGTAFHPVGTCSMSPKGSSHGVVDPDLRVKNVAGVRVVDASILVGVPFCCLPLD